MEVFEAIDDTIFSHMLQPEICTVLESKLD